MNRQRALLVDTYSRPASWQRAATRIDGRALGLTVMLLVLLTCAGLLYLVQASTVAELRYALREQWRQEQEMRERVALLRCQVAESQSITSLEARAERLGLVDASPDDPQVVCYVPAPVRPTPASSCEVARPAIGGRAVLEWLRARLLPLTQP